MHDDPYEHDVWTHQPVGHPVDRLAATDEAYLARREDFTDIDQAIERQRARDEETTRARAAQRLGCTPAEVPGSEYRRQARWDFYARETMRMPRRRLLQLAAVHWPDEPTWLLPVAPEDDVPLFDAVHVDVDGGVEITVMTSPVVALGLLSVRLGICAKVLGLAIRGYDLPRPMRSWGSMPNRPTLPWFEGYDAAFPYPARVSDPLPRLDPLTLEPMS